tara:strand:- start:174 stop:326 length:153 start_codon:yes stop_codon:yes gene_type:complete
VAVFIIAYFGLDVNQKKMNYFGKKMQKMVDLLVKRLYYNINNKEIGGLHG